MSFQAATVKIAPMEKPRPERITSCCLLLGIFFWLVAPEASVGEVIAALNSSQPERPAGRSLFDRRSLGVGGGEDWRVGGD